MTYFLGDIILKEPLRGG